MFKMAESVHEFQVDNFELSFFRITYAGQNLLNISWDIFFAVSKLKK